MDSTVHRLLRHLVRRAAGTCGGVRRCNCGQTAANSLQPQVRGRTHQGSSTRVPLRLRHLAQAQALASAKVSRGRPTAGGTMPEAASFSLKADMSGPASARSWEISRRVPAVLEDLLLERGMVPGRGACRSPLPAPRGEDAADAESGEWSSRQGVWRAVQRTCETLCIVGTPGSGRDAWDVTQKKGERGSGGRAPLRRVKGAPHTPRVAWLPG